MENPTPALIICAILLCTACQSVSAEYFDLKWNYSTKGMVTYAFIDDLDSDGFNEIIGGSSESKLGGSIGWVHVLDRDGNLKWMQETEGGINVMTLGDQDNDGKKEVLAGISYAVYIIDSEGNERKAYLPEHTFKVSEIAVDDMDGEGGNELVVAGSSSKDTRTYILYDQTGWSRTGKLKGLASALKLDDLDSDGDKEIILGIKGRFFDDPGFVYVFDYKGAEVWKFQTKTGVLGLHVEDIDGDYVKEIIAGCKDYAYVLDRDGNSEGEYTIKGYHSNVFTTDVDSDGTKEVVMGSSTLYLLDDRMNTIWSKDLDASAFKQEDMMRAIDVNGDENPEIIAGADKLYIFEGDGTTLGEYAVNSTKFFVKSLDMRDIDSDDNPEVVLGSADGNIYLLWSQVQKKLLDAGRLYSKANELYLEGDSSGAKENALKAKEIYQSIDDTEGIVKSQVLIDKIESVNERVLEEKERADSYYENASVAYKAGDYIEAARNAKIARNIYMSPLEDDERREACDMIIEGSLTQIEALAAETLENATASLGNADPESARSYAAEALEYYTYLKDDTKIAESQAIIDRTEPSVKENDTQETVNPSGPGLSISTDTILKALIVICVIILALLVMNTALGKRKPKDAEKEVREEVTAHHHLAGPAAPKPALRLEETPKESSKPPEEPAKEDKSPEPKPHEEKEPEPPERKEPETPVPRIRIRREEPAAEKPPGIEEAAREDKAARDAPKKAAEKITKDSYRGYGTRL